MWPKISLAYFKNDFNLFLLLVGGGCILYNLPLLVPAYIPKQSCKRASFWSLNPARARTRLKHDINFLSPILSWKPNLPRELKYAQLQSNKKHCVQV